MLELGGGISIPLYWHEPHQFFGGLSIWLFDLLRKQKMELGAFLATLGTASQLRAWHQDLLKSGLIDSINQVLRESGLERNPENPVGDDHQLTYCNLLYFICRSARPRIVVETGVGAGTSSAFILEALSENQRGELFSIERIEDWYTGILVGRERQSRWHLMVGKSVDILPKLLRDIEIDIFVHDSEHTNRTMLFEYTTAWPKIRQSGYLLSDDVMSNFGFYKFARKVPASVVAVVDGYGVVKKGGLR